MSQNSIMKNQVLHFEIAVIGDSGVGKTSIMEKFTQGNFDNDHDKTIGARFSKMAVKLQ